MPWPAPERASGRAGAVPPGASGDRAAAHFLRPGAKPLVSMDQKNRLDLHQIDHVHVGIFRESFERVAPLNGYVLQPLPDVSCTWEFRSSEGSERGRLLDVAGYLADSRVALSARGLLYMTTRQGFTLALLFPAGPRRLRLSEARYKVVGGDPASLAPAGWPEAPITRVIQVRWRKVLLLDEKFLLGLIGLRPNVLQRPSAASDL